MKSAFYIVVLGFFFVGCRTQPPVATTEPPKSNLPPGEVEVIVPCSGPEYFTNGEVFRANSVGESIDISVAKRRALSNARADLAAAIQFTVKEVTDSYVLSREGNNREALSERYEGLSRQVVSQELRGMREICIRYTQTESGRYKAYVAIELSAQNLVTEYFDRLAEIQEFESDADFEKFKKLFEEKMTATKN